MPANKVLPAEVAEALSGIGSLLEGNSGLEGEAENVLQLLNQLAPSAVVRAEREIVDSARLYHHWRTSNRRFSSLLAWSTDVDKRESYLDQLECLPSIKYLFIFHADGTIREAALRKIVSGLPSPFFVAAIAWRLNDWAPQVRHAATECAKRVFPLTAAPVIADAAVALLSRENSWRRWTDERAVLIETLARSDVASSLADIIKRMQTGAGASLLRRAIQQESFDLYLWQLAREAAQPAVRAVALEALIDGVASWPSGFEKQWVDKSMGLARRVRTFNQRPLSRTVLQTQTTTRRQLIVSGATDRSAIVRKVALDGLIRYRSEIADVKLIAAHLALDRIPSVRERALFLLR